METISRNLTTHGELRGESREIPSFETHSGEAAPPPVVNVYTPESPLREPRRFLREMFRDLRASRELAWRLFMRDMSAQYRQSMFGYVWAFLPPLVASLPFIFLNSQGVVTIEGTPIPYPAYAMIGTIIWQVFADALNSPLKTVVAAKSMLVKINLPREAILLSGLGLVVLNCLIRLVLLTLVFTWFKIMPPVTGLLFPVGVVALILVGFTLGLALTPLGLLYNDVQQVIPIATTFLMLLTPVVYPPPQTGVAAMVASWNPLSPLITVTRDWITTGDATQIAAFVSITAVAIVLLFVGWIVYRIALPHIIARLGSCRCTEIRKANMSDVLVKAEGVSKKFCPSLKRSLWYGVQDIFADLRPFAGNGSPAKTYLLSDRNGGSAPNTNSPTESPTSIFNVPLTYNGRNGKDLRRDEFWAVSDVSFELKRGECLGLIGRNGAGKTTLLRMLNGLIKPDKGRITMRGSVGALIALGAGFNPILTGRENIYVNASVLGLSKREIDQKLDEIIDFAEIGKFIDSPVQSYSSGMQVRLGFAVATALDPDILLLDEVLAVGDAAFRARCYNRINKLQRGAAVIFVTHSMEQVSRVCNKALCLSGGKMLYSGDVENAVKFYAELNSGTDDGTESFLSLDEGIEAGSVSIEPQSLPKGGMLDVQVQCSTENALDPCRIRVVLYAEDGSLVAEYDSRGAVVPSRIIGNNYVFKQTIGPINLVRGRYKLGVNLLGTTSPALFLWSHKQCVAEVDGPVAGLSYYQLGAQ